MFESEFILGWFRRHALRPLLCFAAGGQVVDAGGAGGDEGAGGGGGDEGAEGGGDEGAEGGDADADAEGADGEDADADADAETEDEDADAEGAKRDGRAMPDKVKKALAKLAETDKDAAAVARKAYYEAGDYKQVFPTVHEAREAADLIENFGGAEGIGALKKDSTDYASELNAMSKGEPSAVDNLAKDFPQGLVKMAPYAIAKMKDLDPGAYEHHAANLVTESLANYGVTHSLVRLQELIADGKQKEAAELNAQMLKWVRDTAEFAKSKVTPKAGAAGGVDENLSKERQEFEAQKAEEFRGKVATATIQTLDRLLDKELNALLQTRKGLKLTKQQRQSFVHEARGIVANGLGAMAGYKDRIASLLKEGNTEALLRFMRGKALARVNGRHLIAKAARQTWSTRGWASGKPRPAAGGGGGGQGGGSVQQVQAKPNADDIDWSKDRGRTRYMGGEATLKNGKVVRWKW